jgi:hypothetical protein
MGIRQPNLTAGAALAQPSGRVVSPIFVAIFAGAP